MRFYDFFQNDTFFNFKFFFRNFNGSTHVLLDYIAKLNGDSEFLVHFELGPHSMGLKWAKS